MPISVTEIATRGPVAHRTWLRAVSREHPLRWMSEVVLLAALYFGSAKLGFTLGFSGPVAAIVWLPVGIGIAYLYLRGLVFWPGILLGDLLANDYTKIPVGSALAQTVGNVLEVVLAAYLLRRAARSGDLLARLDGLALLLLPLAAATMVSATIGTLASYLGGVVSAGAFAQVWRTWWLGDACGALVVVPFVLAWSRPWRRLSEKQVVEALLMLATTAALTAVAFSSPKALEYLAFPGLIWAGLRFGQRGATLALTVVTGLAIWHATDSSGPFHFHSITNSSLSTQLFIAVATVSTLCVAAIVSERERFAMRLEDSHMELLQTADTERRKLERDLHDGAQQRLVALLIGLRLAQQRADYTSEGTAAMLADTETELQTALDELRELSRGLHPAVLIDLGLATAIRSVAARASQRIHLLELPAVPVDDAVEKAAYYVFLEAITNTQKYALDAEVDVRVHTTQHTLTIEVSDDGPGGASEAAEGGLAGLRERVELAGGTFRLQSIRRVGTTVTAVLPIGYTRQRPDRAHDRGLVAHPDDA
jgi:signal transduction histidine kinase